MQDSIGDFVDQMHDTQKVPEPSQIDIRKEMLASPPSQFKSYMLPKAGDYASFL